MKEIKVLIVEYSLLLGKIISDLLTRDPQIKVVGTVRNHDQALLEIEKLHPDVVILDLDVLGVDALPFIKQITKSTSTPVIMLSDPTKNAIGQILEALETGAIDYIPKPSSNLLDSICLLYTSPSPRDAHESRMPSSA